ncbi:hypothetical protein [Nonomuraea cypriaca]|uniref:hypothetical protein n=1 Tax=Nonomuraea cypriaca TaxID=1187855 RepID=UPI002E2ABD82|nr:hypothetical protein [Nonomuraea cypriaca]
MYDIHAIARLELVRTLRELDTTWRRFAACSKAARPCTTCSPHTWSSSSARSAPCGPGGRCSGP